MKHTKEQIDKIVTEFIDAIDWNKTHKMFMRVKELCGISEKCVSEKTPNQLRRWVENRAYGLMTTEDLEVGYRIETNCIIIEYVEDDYLEMSFKFGPEYEDCDEKLEFIPENFKQTYDSSPEPPDVIIYNDLLNIGDDCDNVEKTEETCVPENFFDFIQNIYERFTTDKPAEWRDGQFIFNYIEKTYGAVAREVQFTDGVDCYYLDNKIEEFLLAVWKRIKK